MNIVSARFKKSIVFKPFPISSMIYMREEDNSFLKTLFYQILTTFHFSCISSHDKDFFIKIFSSQYQRTIHSRTIVISACYNPVDWPLCFKVCTRNNFLCKQITTKGETKGDEGTTEISCESTLGQS